MMLDNNIGYKISPSLLASDFMNLEKECKDVLSAGADWLHFDVMDGHFVPNLSFGLPILSSLRKKFPEAVLDVHLMISNPDIFVGEYVDAGANVVVFHPEVSYHPHRAIQNIKEKGALAGVAINPGTSLEVVRELGHDLDLVLMMSVNPGFGGQSFIETSLDKIRRTVKIREEIGANFAIEVDGGVSAKNIRKIAGAGANIFVAGSAIFKTDNYQKTIEEMRHQLTL